MKVPATNCPLGALSISQSMGGMYTVASVTANFCSCGWLSPVVSAGSTDGTTGVIVVETLTGDAVATFDVIVSSGAKSASKIAATSPRSSADTVVAAPCVICAGASASSKAVDAGRVAGVA